jgi:hypothetical protein
MISKKRQEPGPVLRITVERLDGKWRVIDRFQVPEMTIPSSEDLPSPGRTGRFIGAWFEAVDTKGNVVYRRKFPVPPTGVEIFHEDGSISRTSPDTDLYSMDLLIPDNPKIEAVHLYIEPDTLSKAEKARAPTPVAIFPVRED